MSDAHREVVKALLRRADGNCGIVADRCRPWMSATFAGMRHVIDLAMARAAAHAFLDGIANAEFVLRGHVVADIAGETHDAGVRVEVLTVADAA